MYASFSLRLDIPFYKDLWGYKCEAPVPGTHYGTINANINLNEPPASREKFSQEDADLYNLLNGKPVCKSIDTFFGGVASREVLFTPGAVNMSFYGKNYNVEFERSSDRWYYTFKLTTTIPDIIIPKGEIVSLWGFANDTVQAIKQFLNDPEKYFISSNAQFLTTHPETVEEYTAIYNEERRWAVANKPFNHALKQLQSIPKAEEILLDPLSYTDNKFLPAANFAKILVNGG